ncbi:MAG: hypothetical protein ABEH66_05585 [Halobacteriales archaeon]
MSVPELVRERIGEEPVEAAVDLGDEDELVVTPARTLVYRAEGLIREAAVEEYPHGAESVSVSEGRRKATIELDYGIDGQNEITVPASRLDEVLAPVLGGVLRANGVLEEEETVEKVFRLGELTIVLTEGRILRQIGTALWDEDAEEYAFANVTGLNIEEGEVSSQIIVELDGRPQRIKAPADEARKIRERIERALLSYHDAASYSEFRRRQSDDESGNDPEDPGAETEGSGEDEAPGRGIDFGIGDADGVGSETAGAASDSEDVTEELAALREAVERQNELLESQQRTIKQLIKELRDL